jgi:hypothetical protein
VSTDREQWRTYFAEILISNDQAEVEAAATAAAAAIRSGRTNEQARQAGKAEARAFRQRMGSSASGSRQTSGQRTGTRFADAPGWATELAPRLFAPPTRWGWQAAAVEPVRTAAPKPAPSKPTWTDVPVPDDGALRAKYQSAARILTLRVAASVLLVAAAAIFSAVIMKEVGRFGGEARQYAAVAAGVVALVLLVWVVSAARRYAATGRELKAFTGPYVRMREQEKARFDAAVREWERAVAEQRRQEQRIVTTAGGAEWYPVAPVGEPSRIDVYGGDPWRHGWAALLATVGTSILASRRRITVLDLVGQDVAGGLVGAAAARGLRTRRVHLPEDGAALDLLTPLRKGGLGEALAFVLVGRPDQPDRGVDARHERALVTDVIDRVVQVVQEPVTFARLAAAVHVLRRATPAPNVLTPSEVGRLTDLLDEIGTDEWTAKQLRLAGTQLASFGSVGAGANALLSDDDVTVISTSGVRDDRADLVDRLLIAHTLRGAGSLRGFLVVAGADHLGLRTLQDLSNATRAAQVGLILMIDQPQGDLERAVGTGGAVCLMKMYNHRDASIAAEFIGKGHRFVLSQLTEQIGKSFTDGGSQSFAANTGSSASTGRRARNNQTTDSRGHTWTGTRTWSTADNVGTSKNYSRVHEFEIEPQRLLSLPETAFVLVDNTGTGRRVLLADCNPGIVLRPRVSPTPLV